MAGEQLKTGGTTSVDDLIGKYETRPFPGTRLLTVDSSAIGLSKHYMTALLEFDVTKARGLIRDYRREHGQGLSFLAWFMKCIGRAVSEHREVHALVGRGRRLVVFDDVDIGFLVEKELPDGTSPVPYVIRRVNVKSLGEIHDEVTSARAQTAGDAAVTPGQLPPAWIMRLYPFIPAIIRRAVMRSMMGDPFRAKQIMGTVGVTALGMFGKARGWPLPIGSHQVVFALGAIVDKPAVVGNQIESREFLHLTVLIDHDSVDGAPAARFINRLRQLVEGGFGLEPVEPESTGK